MRKNIEALINISTGKECSASLPFVITSINGERKIIWFNFVGTIQDNRYFSIVSKIFILGNNNNIETLDVNLEIQSSLVNMNDNSYDREAYMLKFHEQFETNQFDDTLELLATAEPSPLLDVYEAIIDYLKNPRTMCCKHCGSDVGFFTKLTGVQYYTSAGDEDGYTVDTQNSSVYCRACKKRVCTYSEFMEKLSRKT